MTGGCVDGAFEPVPVVPAAVVGTAVEACNALPGREPIVERAPGEERRRARKGESSPLRYLFARRQFPTAASR